MQSKWKSKVDSLIRLAEDQAGKPEGELAREKLQQILDKYPWAAQEHKPLGDFAISEFLHMKHVGISHEGSWTGRNLQEALAIMVADYKRRIEEHEQLQRLLDEPDTLLGFPIVWSDDVPQIKEGDIVLGDWSCWVDDEGDNDQHPSA